MSTSNLTYREMTKLANDGHLCAVCNGRLTVAWVNGAYVLRCATDINHKGITRHDKEFEKKMQQVKMDSKALITMSETAMLARISMAKFPQELKPDEKKVLAKVAMAYGFDPLMGEVSIYQGKPYVSIDARYRKAQETGQLDGVETRPATKDERESWKIPDADFFFRADVRVKGAACPFIGWGRVFASEITPGSKKPGDTTSTYKPIQNNPQRMAEKRAEAQALRKAFHIPLPSVETAGSPEDEGIIESTAKVIESRTTENEAIKQTSETERGPDVLTLGRLLEWCLSHGKFYNPAWFYKNQSFIEDELIDNPEHLQQAMREICLLTGWDGI